MSDIEKEYYNWICGLMCGKDHFKLTSFSNLLSMLYDREFIWTIQQDENRAEEGIELRCRFVREYEYEMSYITRYLGGRRSCSILEMMAALAIRCEENIMDDPEIGDRTTQWFWSMVDSLGLGAMYNSRFNPDYIDDVLTKFIKRDYSPNGKGGLFTIKKYPRDLRQVEIWYQLCWYLDNLVGY